MGTCRARGAATAGNTCPYRATRPAAPGAQGDRVTSPGLRREGKGGITPGGVGSAAGRGSSGTALQRAGGVTAAGPPRRSRPVAEPPRRSLGDNYRPRFALQRMRAVSLRASLRAPSPPGEPGWGYRGGDVGPPSKLRRGAAAARPGRSSPPAALSPTPGLT